MHPFWETTKNLEKNRDKNNLVMVAAIMNLSNKEGFTHLTPEEIYDYLLSEALDAAKYADEVAEPQEVLNPRGPHYF